ncbi:MAG: antifreeze protein [Solirubrobacterales bacterium]
MSASRADRRVVRLLAAGLLTFAALPASAQAPVRLVPSDPAAPVLHPPAELQPERRVELPHGRAVGGVEVHALEAMSPESVGTLEARQGAFSQDMWAGTSANVVRRLLPLLPGASGIQAVRDLERRLLLTAAAAPQGADAARANGASLVELRAERLMAMGDVEGVAALAKAAPSAAISPNLARLKLEALFATGNLDAACAETAAGLAQGADGMLAKAQAFCHLAAGRTSEGNLAVDLLRERKDPDNAFIAAAEVLSGLPPAAHAKLSLPKPEPLHVAVFRAAKLPLPADAAANASPAVLRAIALSPAETLDSRLAAGERAEALGGLDAAELRKLYSEALFTPEDMSGALAKAEAGGPRARALLYRLAADMKDPGVQAQIVARALDLATVRGDFAAAVRVFAPLLSEIRPGPENTAIAATLAKALYAAGRPEAAAKWQDVALSGPDTHAGDRLWPYAAVYSAGGQHPLSTTGYAAWRATQDGVPAEKARRRAAVLLSVLSGLGGRVPDAAWLDALDLPAAGPKPALFALMQGGALEARTGITVLATLAALGDAPADKVDVVTLSEAISALAVVGLTADARKLAIEALLANGV